MINFIQYVVDFDWFQTVLNDFGDQLKQTLIDGYDFRFTATKLWQIVENRG